PGPDDLFDNAVYARGAMTLQQLRLAGGGHDFFRILRQWAAIHAGGNVTTDQFIALAERISGQDLGELFTTWLFSPGKPVLSHASRVAQPAGRERPSAPGTRMLLERIASRHG